MPARNTPRTITPPVLVGTDRQDENRPSLVLKPGSLLRHMMALGSSGSGKTVVCKVVVEELVRHGLPAICVDPQGDLCSLALNADPKLLAEKGIDPAIAAEFAQKADVVVFTPAARKGVALSADPISDVTGLPKSERVYAVTGVAGMIVSLLGYDLDSDDGSGLVAVFDRALTKLADAGKYPANLEQFTTWMLRVDGAEKQDLARYLDAKKIDHACQKLARLDVGARRLLFHEGLALDIDLLLGRGPHSAAQPGKARVSVIYLNTLNSQEDKEFFVAALVERLYAWMLKNPSEDPQALFYIDEVAPFIPPVRKPACKPALSLLFKQARKYGVCCLMATQNPADVDYKAMAQFGTWAIGRLTTRQDMAKVQPTVKSLDPVHVDKIMEELPAQKPGQFILISPDNFKHTHRLQTRWLLTEHRTLNDEDIEQLAIERWHDRFAELESAQDVSGEEAEAADEDPPQPQTREKATPEQPSRRPVQPVADEASDDAPEDEPDEETAEEDAEDAPNEELIAFDNRLARKPSVSAAEFALLARVSEGQARSILRKLCNAGLARQYKAGRVQRYWSISNGLRPDLGLDEPVSVFTSRLTMQDAERIGRELRATKTLGVFGDNEELDHIEMEYRLVLQVGFSEKVTRSFWKKISTFDFKALEELADHVYLHPTNLKFVVYTPAGGIRLEDKPADYASRVQDFDGVTTVEKTAPAPLRFNPAELHNRKGDDIVRQVFRQRFHAAPKYVRQMFLPVFQLHMSSRGRTGTRVALIDGLSGKPLVW
jgi:hypothetical protein